ncbi:hypothetical protein ACFVAJ_17345 [Agromyces sp. NPDC057679]|uniref:hypothetical protein n=1 Tax=Agromyces sp. NPDC057679 TaxID=3346207 RepID=UPI00366D31A8
MPTHKTAYIVNETGRIGFVDDDARDLAGAEKLAADRNAIIAAEFPEPQGHWEAVTADTTAF